ncbi:hypothetical protein Esti_005726 [Eimeria stiedai]
MHMEPRGPLVVVAFRVFEVEPPSKQRAATTTAREDILGSGFRRTRASRRSSLKSSLNFVVPAGIYAGSSPATVQYTSQQEENPQGFTSSPPPGRWRACGKHRLRPPRSSRAQQQQILVHQLWDQLERGGRCSSSAALSSFLFLPSADARLRNRLLFRPLIF